MTSGNNKGKINWISASAIVIANMIGTGVFVGLGKQMEYVTNSWTIMAGWVICGLIAVLGALSYAELGSRFPQSGGEYNFLSKTFHPFFGYLSGWVSLTVGFSAPIALAAMAMDEYLIDIFHLPAKWIAISSILIVSFIHSNNIRQSSFFQNAFTVFKVLLIVFLIVASFSIPSQSNSFDWSDSWKTEMISPAFFISLVIVSWAYTGWNAAAYIAGEVKSPVKNLPKALVIGSLLVSILFVFLQIAFLIQVPLTELSGEIDAGKVGSTKMFGETGGQIITVLIALVLIASISAMIWVGPRVTRAMAEDYSIWKFFSKDNKRGIPVRAIWLQTAISIFMITTSSFKDVILYSGFILQLFTAFTVGSIFILRKREKGMQKKHFRAPGYPWVQIIYLLFSVLVLTYLLIYERTGSLRGLLILVAGVLSYWWSKRFDR